MSRKPMPSQNPKPARPGTKSAQAKKSSDKKMVVVTHGANYHADDLFAVATMSLYFKRKGVLWRLVRSLDPSVWDKADYVLDIGDVNDHKANRFDHHQEGGAGVRESGIPYASFGLVWNKFGKAVSGSQDVADYVDRKLVAPLDGSDNGVTVYEPVFEKVSPVTIEDYIGAESIAEKNKPKEKQDFDGSFKRLIPFAERLIALYMEKGKSNVEAKKAMKKFIDAAEDKRIVVSEKFYPFDFEEYPDVMFYVYKSLREGWAAKSPKKHPSSYDSRMPFPEKWRGKRDAELAAVSGVSDASFCHNSGFLATAATREGAIALAKKALLG